MLDVLEDVLEANDLLERAEELRASHRFDDLRMLLLSLPRRAIRMDGELGYYWALVAYRSGKTMVALSRLQRAVEVLPPFENRRVHRRSRNLMGIIFVELGRLGDAEDQFLSAASAAIEVQDMEILAKTTLNLGVIADVRCQWDRAIAAFTRARIAFERLSNHRLAAGSHHNLGMSFRQIGLLSDARAHFDHALDGYARHGTPSDLIATQSERALLLMIEGDEPHARRSAESALKNAEALGQPRLIAECLRVLGIVSAKSGRNVAGKKNFMLALRLARRAHAPMLMAEVLEELAIIEARNGNASLGITHLSKCLKLYAKLGTSARGDRARGRYNSACSGGTV